MSGVRPATPEDVEGIARVHVESWKTTYVGIMPDDLLANLSIERRAAMWSRVLANPETASRVFIAEGQNREIIGFVSGGSPQDEVDGFDGELYAIYLLQSAQGKGYGKALFRALAQRLYEQGYKAMYLWVADNNRPARQFYEAMGGELLPIDKIESFGDQQVREVAYGWRDLSRFSGEGHAV